TVAVYSEADADALHVREADEAVFIGPPPATQSYLLIDRIVEACKQTGAQAVHPGYGFLSEKQEFQKALAAVGITFIGPDAHAIYAMGDKIESKKLAQKAGVSTVPGYLHALKNADEAVKIAKQVGYPVMIKASAGGGGKGMRIAYDDAEAKEGFVSATNEAKASFADDRVFIEKYVEEPRHIEIQLIGDGHGNCVYLWERECSIQRRHQKVIEEAPSPFLDAATRRRMGAQAVALAKAAQYRSAGTVEFVVDRARNFYFLEMNTRLQVEHPVTEFVTGLDLVELMIRIAAGERLPIAQDQVRLQGAAIEARVYAEDPRRNFLPSTGRLARYRAPAGEGVRVDAGVFEGAEISIFYDPMIAKLVAQGEDRASAIRRLAAALDAFVIRGVSNNLGFLSAVNAHERFARGDFSTHFIAEEFPQGFGGARLSDAETQAALALAATAQRLLAERDAGIAGAAVAEDWTILYEDRAIPVKLARRNEIIIVDLYTARQEVTTAWQPGDLLFRATLDGTPIVCQIERRGIGWRVERGGAALDVLVLPPAAAAALARMPEKPKPDLSRQLRSPMPGLLVSIAVAAGQEVKAGEELAVVEAMKMENVLRAERDGRVARLCAKPGDSLAVDQIILEFE
ncbi:MAG TPA: biotin carboxylase N-terminal domain-containing protein, partial [Stellaceae bacterium]|nr:biotin carboxylase N-terminal domain-containing protein [Stellaceae bacterium]